MRYLPTEKVKRFYDAWGMKQDNPGPYESLALDRLCEVGDWHSAQSVFELGPGTGKFALKLLREYLPGDCHYHGMDLSETMLGITQQRLADYRERVCLSLSPGGVPALGIECFDRVAANFVLDIFSPTEINAFFQQAHQGLKSGGLLCLSNLSFGNSWRNKLAISLWRAAYALNPAWMGGCRPLALVKSVNEKQWEIAYCCTTEPRWGIPSEVLVLAKR